MLVLSRKHGESLVIGRDLEIRVLSVQGERVKLGITAPEDVRVMRRELLDAIGPRPRAALFDQPLGAKVVSRSRP